MPAYIETIEDDKGDLVDILYYCEWHRPADVLPWPCYSWPDYDVYCTECGTLIHKGDNDD